MIVIFMCIELMLNSVNLTFIALSRHLGNMDGQIFVFFVMTVAAAEAAVGLALIIAFYRNKESVEVDDFNLLKW
jgi:NADH-quinone oxidoreductase subunit K